MMSTAKYWWQIAVHRILHHDIKKDRETSLDVSPVGNSLYVFAQLHSGLPCLRSWGKYIFQRHKKPVVVKNINLLPYPTKNIFGIHLIHLLQSNEKLFSHYVQLSLPGCENTNSVIFLLSISAPGALCEPIHQTPKVDKTSTSEKFKYSRGHKTTESENLCSRRFFGFTNFLDCKVFAAKKFVAARYGGNKNRVAPLCILNQFSFHFLDIFFIFGHVFLLFWYFWPRISTNLLSIHESALYGRSHDWTIALCNEHWKLLFRARDLNIIFTQNLGQDLIELIYHLIKGNPKFPTEELGANPAKVKSVSKQFPPSVTPIEGKRRKASNSR